MSSAAFAFKDNVTANKSCSYWHHRRVHKEIGCQGQGEKMVQCKLFFPGTGPSLTGKAGAYSTDSDPWEAMGFAELWGAMSRVKTGALKNGRGERMEVTPPSNIQKGLKEWPGGVYT